MSVCLGEEVRGGVRKDSNFSAPSPANSTSVTTVSTSCLLQPGYLSSSERELSSRPTVVPYRTHRKGPERLAPAPFSRVVFEALLSS